MTTFTIPGSAVSRLARLVLATEAGSLNALNHIALRITSAACRFTATTGRILASIFHEVADLQGDPTDLILARDQFAAAWKLLGKNLGKRVSFTVTASEVRITSGSVSAVIRRVEGAYPAFDHIWSKTVDMRWVPCLSSLDPSLVAMAQQIAGKATVLFSSPIHPDSLAPRLWLQPGPSETNGVMPLSTLQGLVNAPAYWADGDLAILVMPISRAGEQRQLDLSRFACAVRAVSQAGVAA